MPDAEHVVRDVVPGEVAFFAPLFAGKKTDAVLGLPLGKEGLRVIFSLSSGRSALLHNLPDQDATRLSAAGALPVLVISR